MSIIDPDGNLRPGRTVAWGLLLIVGVLATVWGVRAYRASTSGSTGTLNIQQQRGSAANREQWSSYFTTQYHSIQADQANIQVDAKVVASKGSTPQDATNLEGTEQACNQDVSDWNAALDNVLAVVPAGYPQTKLDPESVCSIYPDTTGLLNP